MSANELRLLTRREVERRTGLRRSAIYNKMNDGTFPRPVKVGTRNVRWRESDIIAWIQSRPDADGTEAK